jgi:hypothetical protein
MSWFLRLAASGWVSPRWFLPNVPDQTKLPARTRELSLEIVSHCWQYSHLLAYQLSSLVLHPPTKLTVRVTVFYSPEDTRTAELLRFFSGLPTPKVTWNWRPLDRWHLFRRAIGRNLAALQTAADWIWFTDCDVVFHEGCLDALADSLQGRRDPLVFPREEKCTALLASTDPLLEAAAHRPALVAIDPTQCHPVVHTRAVGPLQIAHGDVARQIGYCACLRYYQKPAARWQKAYEDRAFRWLLRTHGTPIDVPGVFRIKHLDKGRYRAGHWTANVRRAVRQIQGNHRSNQSPQALPDPTTPAQEEHATHPKVGDR